MDNATPLKPAKKPANKFFLIANIVLLFIVVAIGGYYLTIYKPSTTKPKATTGAFCVKDDDCYSGRCDTITKRCGGGPTIPTNPPDETNTPIPTKTPTPSPTSVITNTPAPTSTPIPTATLTPTTPPDQPTNTPGPTATPIPVPCGTKDCDNSTNPCRSGYICVQANDGSNYCSSPDFATACKANPSFNSCCTAPGAPTATPTTASTIAPTQIASVPSVGTVQWGIFGIIGTIILIGLLL